jgi:hypothetical protein
MGDLLRACSAEMLKLRRTLALRLAVIMPLLLVLLQFMYVVRVRHLRGSLWQALTQGTMGWSILVLPLTTALLTALLNGIEHRGNNWKLLFALPLSRGAVYTAKVVAAQALLALSHLTLWGGLLAAGLLLHRLFPALPYGPPPWRELAQRLTLMYAASGAMIAIHVWVSARCRSFTVPLGLGIGAAMVSVAGARDWTLVYYPWMFAANATTPDRLPIALTLGVAGGLAISILGAWDTARRDVP